MVRENNMYFWKIIQPTIYMKRSSRILAFIVLMLGFIAISNGLKAQNVVRQGDTFVVQGATTTDRGKFTKTQYTLETRKGDTVIVDTICLSSTGSAFVWKVSKKTGKPYRKYLPEITKQLGTKKEKKWNLKSSGL